MENRKQDGHVVPDSGSETAGQDASLIGDAKRAWITPTLTRLPGEDTEAVQPSFGIQKFLIAGS